VADRRLVMAAPLSLSGRYALQGRAAAAGLEQLADDVRHAGGLRLEDAVLMPELVVLDDTGTGKGTRRCLDLLSGAHLLFGPYGSDLVRAAAGWSEASERLVWNHGGSADDVQRHPQLVSVPSPSSRYLATVLEAIAGSLPDARVLIAAGGGRFGRAAAEGARAAAVRLGMEVVAEVSPGELPAEPEADAVLLAGSFDEDVGAVARLHRRPPVLAAVAAGLVAFGERLGERAHGVLGPTQWEEGARFRVDAGPAPTEALRSLRARAVPSLRAAGFGAHLEYPAAQAYASGVVALRCVEKAEGWQDEALAAASRRLRCTTFFGRFGLGADGRQEAHEMLVVQWSGMAKRVVWPASQAEVPVSLGRR
jgi:branched-chain amino acid transport system substrate-binding protein